MDVIQKEDSWEENDLKERISGQLFPSEAFDDVNVLDQMSFDRSGFQESTDKEGPTGVHSTMPLGADDPVRG